MKLGPLGNHLENGGSECKSQGVGTALTCYIGFAYRGGGGHGEHQSVQSACLARVWVPSPAPKEKKNMKKKITTR